MMPTNRKFFKEQQRPTAYHEAGHAVCHYIFGVELDWVAIQGDPLEGYEFGRTQPVKKQVNLVKRFFSIVRSLT